MGSINRVVRVGHRYRRQEPGKVGRLAVDMPDGLQEVNKGNVAARVQSRPELPEGQRRSNLVEASDDLIHVGTR